MTREEFAAAVAQYEVIRARHPRLFKWRVAGRAALGISYLVGVLV